MSFEELLFRAKQNDQEAVMQIIDKYHPLLIKNAMVQGRFDEDLYQELVVEVLKCIQRFEVR